ncbi:hypothetical protein [Cypionkella sp.]|uniref:hypothetical protein n=1 Tax=Cypionkella sp. TaxID=2811411 RepID=UPI003752FBC5
MSLLVAGQSVHPLLRCLHAKAGAVHPEAHAIHAETSILNVQGRTGINCRQRIERVGVARHDARALIAVKRRKSVLLANLVLLLPDRKAAPELADKIGRPARQDDRRIKRHGFNLVKF